MNGNGKPDFTAFVVACLLLALKRQPRWRTLIPDASAAVYEACVCACGKARLGLFLLTWIPDPARVWLADRLLGFGYAQHIALRKRMVEVQARAEIMRGAAQVAVLGAGFDALGVRLAREFPHLRFYELDRPATQRVKREALRLLGLEAPENLHFIACNLAAEALEEVMSGAPEFSAEARTLLIAEGVSMYLTEAQNIRWLAAIRALCGGQAVLILSAFQALDAPGRIAGAARDAVLRCARASFRWAMPRENMAAFLAAQGYVLKQGRSFAELQQESRTPQEHARLMRQPGENVYVAAAKAERAG